MLENSLFRGFQISSKLSANFLSKDEARKYYSDIKYHAADISIMLAGVGYKETFLERLFGHPDINPDMIHLLTLQDLLEKSIKFENALKYLPTLESLDDVLRFQ